MRKWEFDIELDIQSKKQDVEFYFSHLNMVLLTYS